MMSLTLPSQRHLFDIPEDVAYFNCAFMSPLMQRVLRAGETAMRAKVHPWEMGVSHFYDDVSYLRSQVSQLMGCRTEDVAFVPSVSYGVAVAAANLEVAAGSHIVVLAEQFPSNVYCWGELAKERQAAVRTIARPGDGDWTTAVLAGLDGDVSIAALPHCHWADGSLLDLERIGAHCRQHGIALVLDTTQSLGAMTLDLAKVQPDFMVAAAYKWLMGSYGFAYLYVADKYQRGKPLEFNWMPRKDSARFDRLVDYTDEFEPGAQRFDMGERSSFVHVAMCKVAVEQILDWNVARIQASLGSLTQYIKDETAALGFQANVPHAPHLLGLRRDRGLPEDGVQQLKQRQVFVSVRGDAIRISPHLYNTEADAARLIAALRDLH